MVGARAPEFTVVIATRDRPELLADALSGAAAQRHQPLEVRIGDDGSRPLAAALAAAAPLEVTCVRCASGSAAGARNRAAAGARGTALAFLDDDDRWAPGHLEGLAVALAEPGVDVAFRDSVVVRERIGDDGRRVDLERRRLAREWNPEIMRTDDYVPPSAFAVRRALFERLGGFDESFRFSEDWDFLLRAAALSTPRRVPGATVEIRLRERGNASAERGAERAECLARLARRHALPPLEIKTFWEVAAAVGEVEGSP